jgi:hypothetical protein
MLKMVKMGNFMQCEFYHNKKNWGGNSVEKLRIQALAPFFILWILVSSYTK